MAAAPHGPPALQGAATSGGAGAPAHPAHPAHSAHRDEGLADALNARYVVTKARVTPGAMTVGPDEYRFRGDSSQVAFTASPLRLATAMNDPSVARSMVDVAQARRWTGLRLSGAEDFRRLVWLEASVRGVKTIGYAPSPGDLDRLERERAVRQAGRRAVVIDPALDALTVRSAAPDGERWVRGAGRQAVVAAIDAVLSARHVPEARRAAVLAAVAAKLAQRGHGEPGPRVKVYDPSAPPQHMSPAPSLAPGRSRERAAPAPAR